MVVMMVMMVMVTVMVMMVVVMVMRHRRRLRGVFSESGRNAQAHRQRGGGDNDLLHF